MTTITTKTCYEALKDSTVPIRFCMFCHMCSFDFGFNRVSNKCLDGKFNGEFGRSSNKLIRSNCCLVI